MLKVGFVGLGYRGMLAVERFLHIPGVEIAAVCDCDFTRLELVSALLSNSGLESVPVYGEWKELCTLPGLDLVYICTPWSSHVEISVYAMQHGHHAAVEVPASLTLSGCWELVDVSRKTGRHIALLENCVYDLYEMSTAAMAADGLFGEIYHAEAGYIHNIKEKNTWRVDFNSCHRGDFYPTHGLGPVCRAMGIGVKDRLDWLVSVDSPFGNGCFHTTTTIRTEKGHTILLQHNIDAARPYSRQYQLLGTKGYACKYPEEHFSFSDETDDFIDADRQHSIIAEYTPVIWQKNKCYLDTLEPKRRMDYIMDLKLVECLRSGQEPDINVYDAALWSCIGELSSESIVNGSAPVKIPDFRRP